MQKLTTPLVPRAAAVDQTMAGSPTTAERVALGDQDVDADETTIRDSSNNDSRVVSQH
jgi:hypothetical protein